MDSLLAACAFCCGKICIWFKYNNMLLCCTVGLLFSASIAGTTFLPHQGLHLHSSLAETTLYKDLQFMVYIGAASLKLVSSSIWLNMFPFLILIFVVMNGNDYFGDNRWPILVS